VEGEARIVRRISPLEEFGRGDWADRLATVMYQLTQEEGRGVKRISQLEEFGRIHREALDSVPQPMKGGPTLPRMKAESEGCCRACGALDPDAHHIVHRRLGGDDWPDNIVPLCRVCHQAVHDRKLDLIPLLDLKEQGYAASLIGIERAHRLLAPSVYKSERLR
jgi:5-methylcytosine-specific restriction endonuclease McrA